MKTREIKKMIFNSLLFLFISMNVIKGQIISDNTYAFGFENLFNFNVSHVQNKSVENAEIRMFFYEDINDIPKNYIAISIRKLENEKEYVKLTETIENNQQYEIIKKIKNAYSSYKSIIFIDTKNNKLFSVIYHFGYVLHINYTTKDKLNRVLFSDFVETYINIQVNL